jgi:signal transduction histidine kinase
MKLKPTVKYSVLGVLSSFVIVPPVLVMSFHAMGDAKLADQHTMSAIVRSFTLKILFWSSSVAAFCTLMGYWFGKVKQHEKRLQETNAAKDQFFSILAHDLRSPLSVVLGFLDLMRTGYDTFDEHVKKRYICNSYEAAKQLFDLLEDILEWSRIQRGKMPWQPDRHDLFSLIDETLVLLQASAEKKQIGLRMQIAENTPVYADAQMIKTVIRNLVSNALKFTEAGGEVTITSKSACDHEEITITDTGIGINPNDLPNLFRIDVIYSTPGTEKERGTGLGLILCKEFVEKHGGKIWVESTVGRGSQFHFTLPKMHAAGKLVRQDHKPRNLPKERVLADPDSYCAEYQV